MVEQGGELHPLPFLRCFAHTRQPLGYASLALYRVRAGLMSVLLDQRPSLLTLRRWFPTFVRVIRRCRVGGGAFARWPPSAAQTVRAVFPHTAFTKTHASEMQSKGLDES